MLRLRFWNLFAIACCVVAVSGCASTHMKQFIGKDARLIQIEDGPLVNAFDLPEGRRAFQFRWGGGTYVVPKTTTTTGQVQLVGSTAFYSEQKLEAGGAVVNDPGCLITYIAKWDATKQGWIVSEIAYPHRAFC